MDIHVIRACGKRGKNGKLRIKDAKTLYACVLLEILLYLQQILTYKMV